MSVVGRLREYFKGRQILLGLIGAIMLALILTTVSLRFYMLSDVSHLDLSLPGHEKSRAGVEPEKQTKFDATGPIDSNVMNNFQKLFSDNRKDLDALDKFDGTPLDDKHLTIGTNE